MRSRLGEEAYNEGAAMSLDEAIAYARATADHDTTGEQIAATSPSTGLSKRETEVVKLLADGRSNHEIADILFISPHTAAHHVTSILNKLGVESRTAATAWAIKQVIA